jgi:thioredoxin reductase
MYDAIIIGGSYAGLAAALQLARARRQVLILDAGQRRNRFASHSHGFLGYDGRSPEFIAAAGREDVLVYATVTWRDSLATGVSPTADGFLVRAGTEEFRGRRLILATGVVDDPPAIPGLADRWGKRVFHCPYCDGYELRGGRLGVLATTPTSTHFAVLVSEWATPGQMTLFLNGAIVPSAEELANLEVRRISIEPERVVSVGGSPEVIDVHLQDERTVTLDGLFLVTRTRLSGPFAEQLGCELEMGPLGPYYKTDAMKETTVPGVFACGDAAQPLAAIAYAVADGVRAGAFTHQSLVFRSAGA